MAAITVSISPQDDSPHNYDSPSKLAEATSPPTTMPFVGSSQPIIRDTRPISTIDVFGFGAPSTIPLGSTIFDSIPPVSPTDSSFSTDTRSKKTSVSRAVMSAFESSRPFRKNKGGIKAEPQEIQMGTLGPKSVASDDLQRIGSGSSSTPSQKGAAGTVRVVGRGGRGSRPRTATGASQLQEPAAKPVASSSNLGPMPSIHTSLEIPRPSHAQRETNTSGIRVVGRGGTGSRPRKLAPDKEEVDATLLSKIVAQDLPPQTFRVPGRGGIGSRPRQVKPKDKNLETKSNPGTSRFKFKSKWKGKGKAESISSLPVYDIRRIRSKDSNSSLSTMHFAGDSASIAPTFTSIQDGSIASDVSSDNLSLEREQSSAHAKRRFDKLTKTLGDLPPNFIYDTLHRERPSKFDNLPPIITDSLPSNSKPEKANQRTSFSSFSSFMPNNRRQSTSAYTLSTTGDVHQFPVMDNLFDGGWGKVSARASMRSDITSHVSSPITFAPPTPTTAAPVKRGVNTSVVSVASEPVMTSPIADADEEELEASEGVSSLPSPALGRSHSFSHVPRRRGERAHGHSASTSQPRPDTPFDLPVKTNWLNPPREDGAILIARAEPQQLWEGKWNDDLHHVIRSLRTLR